MGTHMEDRLARLSGAERAARDVAEDARLTRDQAIAEAEQAGWPMRAISDATGLSTSQVGRILVAQAARVPE